MTLIVIGIDRQRQCPGRGMDISCAVTVQEKATVQRIARSVQTVVDPHHSCRRDGRWEVTKRAP
jgi:hypothetical protein